MTSDPNDPAAIAKGLTDDEKYFLPLMIPGKSHRVSTFYPMLQRFRGKGLVEVAVSGFDFFTSLTPLGVAVREALKGGG